ncbi:hypothetical protein ACFVTY_08735 [Streptomyces sp. NPDC058067]|uniref:hypothetical protein n=1 Tax=Streptomyces sp. NPDC058067 TaxID=3346324 RepID=UPI0036E28F40
MTTTACLTALAPGTVSAPHPMTAPARVTAPAAVTSEDSAGSIGSEVPRDSVGPSGDSATARATSVAEVFLSPTTVSASSTVEITVSCGRSGQGSITASSHAFAEGSVTLPSSGGARGQDGDRTQYRGTARLAGASGFTAAAGSQFAVDGSCPDGKRWSAPMTVEHDTPRAARAGVGGSADGGVDLGRIGLGTALAGGSAFLLWRRTRAPRED